MDENVAARLRELLLDFPFGNQSADDEAVRRRTLISTFRVAGHSVRPHSHARGGSKKHKRRSAAPATAMPPSETPPSQGPHSLLGTLQPHDTLAPDGLIGQFKRRILGAGEQGDEEPPWIVPALPADPTTPEPIIGQMIPEPIARAGPPGTLLQPEPLWRTDPATPNERLPEVLDPEWRRGERVQPPHAKPEVLDPVRVLPANTPPPRAEYSVYRFQFDAQGRPIRKKPKIQLEKAGGAGQASADDAADLATAGDASDVGLPDAGSADSFSIDAADDAAMLEMDGDEAEATNAGEPFDSQFSIDSLSADGGDAAGDGGGGDDGNRVPRSGDSSDDENASGALDVAVEVTPMPDAEIHAEVDRELAATVDAVINQQLQWLQAASFDSAAASNALFPR